MHVIQFEPNMSLNHNGFSLFFWKQNRLVVGLPDNDIEDQVLNVVPNFMWTNDPQDESGELYIRVTDINTDEELDIPLVDIKSVTSEGKIVLH